MYDRKKNEQVKENKNWKLKNNLKKKWKKRRKVILIICFENKLEKNFSVF